MLISDTGGGHRASAQALETMFEQLRPGETDVRIVDVWTNHAKFPFNTFVSSYALLAKNPVLWKLSWHGSAIPPVTSLLNALSAFTCHKTFRECIEEHDPHLVLSLHPLTQALPLQVLSHMGDGRRTVPFATVVTDLGSAHPTWFHRKVDACFIPSDQIRGLAKRSGLKSGQLRQYGLPVRPAFWQPSRPKADLLRELGLASARKTVLVVGGGDGVGSLASIVEATAAQLSKECPGEGQVIAVCGKNKKLQARLEKLESLKCNVQVRGFVRHMSDYMEVSDCIVTKAGPGTIAEAAIRGLPTMLSSYLPGQEAGNVPFVTESGFGEYSNQPKEIARRVSSWVQDPGKLEAMSLNARVASSPRATQAIATDLMEMLDKVNAES